MYTKANILAEAEKYELAATREEGLPGLRAESYRRTAAMLREMLEMRERIDLVLAECAELEEGPSIWVNPVVDAKRQVALSVKNKLLFGDKGHIK